MVAGQRKGAALADKKKRLKRRVVLRIVEWLLGFFKKPPVEDGGDQQNEKEVDVIFPEPEPELPSENSYCWILDPGHGKLTQESKRSPTFKDGYILYEWELNQDIVNRLSLLLSDAGIEYIITVPTHTAVNVGNYLTERVRIANDHISSKPKLFVSVHSNAAPARNKQTWVNRARGIEVWHFHGSILGKKMASVFLKSLVRNMGWKNRGLKSKMNKQFYVLRRTKMVSVLVEIGFMNNQFEAAELRKPLIRQRAAQALFEAISHLEKTSL